MMLDAARQGLYVLYRYRYGLVLLAGLCLFIGYASRGWLGLAVVVVGLGVTGLFAQFVVQIAFGTWKELQVQARGAVARAEASAIIRYDREEFNASFLPALNFALGRSETAAPLHCVVARFDRSGVTVHVKLDGATPDQIAPDQLASRLTSRWRPVARVDVAPEKRAGWAIVQVTREDALDQTRGAI